MRIQLLVLHGGVAAPDMHGEQANAVLDRGGQRLLPFGNDDDGRGGDDDARVLIGGGADAARNHQADVAAVHHIVRGDAGV